MILVETFFAAVDANSVACMQSDTCMSIGDMSIGDMELQPNSRGLQEITTVGHPLR